MKCHVYVIKVLYKTYINRTVVLCPLYCKPGFVRGGRNEKRREKETRGGRKEKRVGEGRRGLAERRKWMGEGRKDHSPRPPARPRHTTLKSGYDFIARLQHHYSPLWLECRLKTMSFCTTYGWSLRTLLSSSELSNVWFQFQFWNDNSCRFSLFLYLQLPTRDGISI